MYIFLVSVFFPAMPGRFVMKGALFLLEMAGSAVTAIDLASHLSISTMQMATSLTLVAATFLFQVLQAVSEPDLN
jgi:hypothetical protein